jgi:peptide chain release factor 2
LPNNRRPLWRWKRSSRSWEAVFDLAGKAAEKEEIEKKMQDPAIWNNPKAAGAMGSRMGQLKRVLESHESLVSSVTYITELIELAEMEEDKASGKEIDAELKDLTKRYDEYELNATLSGEHDTLNCFVNIHPGAGGTESCDWANMLMRMYGRFFELQGFSVEEIDLQPGDEAGIKNATFLIKGEYAYGYLKGEMGTHRLVRISPFDASSRRHTSFAAVTVVPELDDTIEFEIEDKDVRVDTYRSSGAGGQHVNKTSSAIRLTHQPSGIVVCCQNQRSQHKNKATAFKELRSRLYALKQQEQQDKVEQATGTKTDIAWGHQIRSYVFHPYNMVKDHRTGWETGNVPVVMDGGLMPFIEAYLNWSLSGKTAGETTLQDDG